MKCSTYIASSTLSNISNKMTQLSAIRMLCISLNIIMFVAMLLLLSSSWTIMMSRKWQWKHLRPLSILCIRESNSLSLYSFCSSVSSFCRLPTRSLTPRSSRKIGISLLIWINSLRKWIKSMIVKIFIMILICI